MINFGSHILETRDINQIKVLLSIDNFDIFIVNYPEELDPLKDKKLKVLKKTVDVSMSCLYSSIYIVYMRLSEQIGFIVICLCQPQ